MNGLTIDLMDVERFIKVNKLENSIVTDPHYLMRGYPTPNGVLSHSIFGSSVEDRKEKFGIIDLHGHYMTPLAAKKLKAYDRKLSNILFATDRYRLENGELIPDDEGGRTGPSFLYEIWGKYKPKDKESITTKEVEKYFELPRDVLFIKYLPVIPAFYRDVNSQTGGKMSLADINSIYSRIITLAQNLSSFSDAFGLLKPSTEARLQTSLVEIYDKLMIEKIKGSPAKFGMLNRYWLAKSITYTARMVITAPILTTESVASTPTKFGYANIPVSYVCSLFFPFIVHELKNYLDNEFIRGGKYPVFNSKTKEVEYITIEDTFDENQIASMVTKFLNSPSTRFDPVEVPGSYGENGDKKMKMAIVGENLRDGTTIRRAATVTDLLFIAASTVAKDHCVLCTRYPLDSYQGQVPFRIQVSSTTKTIPARIGREVYDFYPLIEGDPNNAFIETLGFSNTYLEGFNGDLTYHHLVPALATAYTKICERLTSGVCDIAC